MKSRKLHIQDQPLRLSQNKKEPLEEVYQPAQGSPNQTLNNFLSSQGFNKSEKERSFPNTPSLRSIEAHKNVRPQSQNTSIQYNSMVQLERQASYSNKPPLNDSYPETLPLMPVEYQNSVLNPIRHSLQKEMENNRSSQTNSRELLVKSQSQVHHYLHSKSKSKVNLKTDPHETEERIQSLKSHNTIRQPSAEERNRMDSIFRSQSNQNFLHDNKFKKIQEQNLIVQKQQYPIMLPKTVQEIRIKQSCNQSVDSKFQPQKQEFLSEPKKDETKFSRPNIANKSSQGVQVQTDFQKDMMVKNLYDNQETHTMGKIDFTSSTNKIQNSQIIQEQRTPQRIGKFINLDGGSDSDYNCKIETPLNAKDQNLQMRPLLSIPFSKQLPDSTISERYSVNTLLDQTGTDNASKNESPTIQTVNIKTNSNLTTLLLQQKFSSMSQKDKKLFQNQSKNKKSNRALGQKKTRMNFDHQFRPINYRRNLQNKDAFKLIDSVRKNIASCKDTIRHAVDSGGGQSTAQSIWQRGETRHKKAASSLASIDKNQELQKRTAISALLLPASTINSDADPYNIGDSIISCQNTAEKNLSKALKFSKKMEPNIKIRNSQKLLLPKFDVYDAVQFRKAEALNNANDRKEKIQKNQVMMDLFEIKSSKSKLKLELQKVFVQQKQEYYSKQAQRVKSQVEEEERETKIENMLVRRGLQETEFLKKSGASELMPLVITLPVSVVENPHVEGSMDMQFSKATQHLNQKRYLQALQQFKKCEISYRINRFSKKESFSLKQDRMRIPEIVSSSSTVSEYQPKDIEEIIKQENIESESSKCSKHKHKNKTAEIDNIFQQHSQEQPNDQSSSFQATDESMRHFEILHGGDSGYLNKMDKSEFKQTKEQNQLLQNIGIQIDNKSLSRVAQALISNTSGLSSHQRSSYIAEFKPNLVELQKYYQCQSQDYFDKMHEITQINKGVWFFKNNQWKKAQKVWDKLDAKTTKTNSASKSEGLKKVFYPLTLAWNQALISCLNKDFDICMEKIQKIVFLLQSLDKYQTYKELALSGVKFFKQKLLTLFSNFETKLKSQHQHDEKQQRQTNDKLRNLTLVKKEFLEVFQNVLEYQATKLSSLKLDENLNSYENNYESKVAQQSYLSKDVMSSLDKFKKSMEVNDANLHKNLRYAPTIENSDYQIHQKFDSIVLSGVNSSIVSPGSSIVQQKDSLHPHNSKSIDFMDRNSLEVNLDSVLLPFSKSKQNRLDKNRKSLNQQFRRYKDHNKQSSSVSSLKDKELLSRVQKSHSLSKMTKPLEQPSPLLVFPQKQKFEMMTKKQEINRRMKLLIKTGKDLVKEREEESPAKIGIEGFHFALEMKQKKDERELLRRHYQSKPKKVVRNALTKSHLESMQLMVETTKNYKERNNIQQMVGNKSDAIHAISDYIETHEQGQCIQDVGQNNTKFGDLPGIDVVDQWKNIKVFNQGENGVIQDSKKFKKGSLKDEAAELHSMQNYKKLVDNIKFYHHLRNKWRKRVMLMGHKNLQEIKKLSQKSPTKKPESLMSKHAVIWQRAFKKIMFLKMQQEQDELRQRVECIELKKSKLVMDQLNFVEGKTIFQRVPNTADDVNKNKESYEVLYQESIQVLEYLRWYIDNIEDLQQQKDEEFNDNVNRRIDEAMEYRLTLPGFDEEDKSMIKFTKKSMKKQTLVKDAELTGDILKEEQNHPSFQKRLRLFEADAVLQYVDEVKKSRFVSNNIDKYLTRFAYFSKYSEQVRSKLMEVGTLKIYQKNEVIYRQGDPSPNVFFILRGSIALSVNKRDLGSQTIVIKIMYDGSEFGEFVNLKESKDFSQKVIDDLNRQKCTTRANELSHIFIFNKQLTAEIIEQGLQQDFQRKVKFLRSMSIFKDCGLQIILPLANSITYEKYQMGQFILKEGQVPRGLYILMTGQCRAGSQMLSVRSTNLVEYAKQKAKKKPLTLKGNFKDEQKRNSQMNRERLPDQTDNLEQWNRLQEYKAKNEQNDRMMICEKMRRDEDGTVINDHTVYKEMITFFKLLEKDIFGGRVMVTKTHANQNMSTGDELDHNDSKDTDKSVDGGHQPSQLSVIADSSEVELLLINKNNMHLYPEDVQLILNERLSSAFSAERPYSDEMVSFIKNRFKQWDQFKIKAFLHQIKIQFNIRNENLIKQSNTVIR